MRVLFFYWSSVSFLCRLKEMRKNVHSALLFLFTLPLELECCLTFSLSHVYIIYVFLFLNSVSFLRVCCTVVSPSIYRLQISLASLFPVFCQLYVRALHCLSIICVFPYSVCFSVKPVLVHSVAVLFGLHTILSQYSFFAPLLLYYLHFSFFFFVVSIPSLVLCY